jgi:hypothetical protein
MFVQNLDNNSFRTVTLMMDTTNIYLQERFFVRRQTLPALTRRYTLLVFENAATVTLV